MGTTRYEVWLPGEAEPEASFLDGDKAARYARDNGGVMVVAGTSEEDRQVLLDARFPKPAPTTAVPAGIEVALSQARDRANRDVLEDQLYDAAREEAESNVPKAVADAEKAAEEGRAQIAEEAEVHAEAHRISLTEPERFAGGEPSPLPTGTEISPEGKVVPTTSAPDGESTSAETESTDDSDTEETSKEAKASKASATEKSSSGSAKKG